MAACGHCSARGNTRCTQSVMLEPVRLTEHLRDTRKSENKQKSSSAPSHIQLTGLSEGEFDEIVAFYTRHAFNAGFCNDQFLGPDLRAPSSTRPPPPPLSEPPRPLGNWTCLGACACMCPGRAHGGVGRWGALTNGHLRCPPPPFVMYHSANAPSAPDRCRPPLSRSRRNDHRPHVDPHAFPRALCRAPPPPAPVCRPGPVQTPAPMPPLPPVPGPSLHICAPRATALGARGGAALRSVSGRGSRAYSARL